MPQDLVFVENFDSHTLPSFQVLGELHLGEGPLAERPPQLVLAHPGPPHRPHSFPSRCRFKPQTPQKGRRTRNPPDPPLPPASGSLLLARLPHLRLHHVHRCANRLGKARWRRFPASGNATKRCRRVGKGGNHALASGDGWIGRTKKKQQRKGSNFCFCFSTSLLFRGEDNKTAMKWWMS